MILLLPLATLLAAEDGSYRKPPKEILDVLNAPATPQGAINPTGTHLLLTRSRRYPPIAEVSQPMLRLAGLRINPRNSGPHLGPVFLEFSLRRIEDGREIAVALPAGARAGAPRWSPDGNWFAFTNTRPDTIELWIGEAATGRIRQAAGVKVNAALGETIQWLPGSKAFLVQTVPPNRGKMPEPPTVPTGPRIQESAGKYAPVRTYQDLLTGEYDERLFEHFATSRILSIDAATLKAIPFGEPGIYRSFDPSPDGAQILYTRIQRPYSLLHPNMAFPRQIGTWDKAGRPGKVLFTRPLEDAVPIDGVGTGPRGIAWRPDEPATLAWTEALDGGDPKKKVPHRDRIMSWKSPFDSQPSEWMRSQNRVTGINWAKGFALVHDFERARRWTRTQVLNLSDTGVEPKTIINRSSQDQYRDPGSPVEHTTLSGHRMLLQEGDWIYLKGEGATPSGARPFLDKRNIKTGETQRLFRAGEQGYERVVDVPGKDRMVTERESTTEPPNYFVRDAGREPRALTSFQDPTPRIRRIRKQLVTYQRADGVSLSFTLYLPPDYREGTRLPTVVWAYPREYVDAGTAGQFGGSTQRFTTITGASHLFYVLAGYAVLDDAAIPVVGPPETVNNTYVEQIVASAKAAIDKAAEIGVTDPNRVGVAGHSYGGFMTANLLAHSDLFRAGVARSGAYNRTLTPFGFQAEPRTYWEAQDIYHRMSPFMAANKINEPILLIHGEADNNPGTFPIQSDRMYQAVRGNGGNVRLVFLPHESHGYAGRESVEHTLAEMIDWFDKHVKGARGAASGN